MERAVSFQSAGLVLYGVLGEPAGIGPGTSAARPRAVVIIHGWGGYRIGPHAILVQAARQFTREGFPTLRFDLRGRGDSEGDSMGVDLDGMIEDTCAAVGFVRRETGASQIALLGICSGANVAMGAATLLPEVDVLLLWSALPFAPQKRMANGLRKTAYFFGQYARKLTRAHTWKKFLSGGVDLRMVLRVLFRRHPRKRSAQAPAGNEANNEGRNPQDSRRDIMADFASFRGRALFIHGEKDPEARGAMQVFGEFSARHSFDADFELIEGASHNFLTLAQTRRVIELTARRLTETETARPLPQGSAPTEEA